MSAQERRDLFLALAELVAAFYPDGSPEREGWAELWDEAQALPGLPDDSRLLPAVMSAMREAAHNLERAVALYGPEGPMAELFAEQRERLSQLSAGPLVRRGLTEHKIRATAQKVRERKDQHPTRDEVAAALFTSVATLKRAMKELGMEGWPPAAPDD